LIPISNLNNVRGIVKRKTMINIRRSSNQINSGLNSEKESPSPRANQTNQIESDKESKNNS
jgi:uncharacterized protein (UPF0147 family)